MDKEKVKNYLWNYFFPITSASQEERRGMYRCAIEDGYLHYEDDLTEWERKQQWEEFDRLTLNCNATSVTIDPSVTGNTVNIVYHVDGNVSDDCVCPIQLEYRIAELLFTTFNFVFWLDDQIIHQQSYTFH